MHNKTSFIINLTDYAELVGLCGIGPIMRKVTQKIMRAHNRIIPPSLYLSSDSNAVHCEAQGLLNVAP